MPTFEEARTIILDSVVPLGVEKVEMLSAVGRVLAEDIPPPGICPSGIIPPWTAMPCMPLIVRSLPP